ncbi:MAG: maleylpyruvate isomerase N-terminal domain-containing protein [Flavipsychrobacter sp.]|nr:maleylpyruvate isomerase N-terminal domain-containing protein [Flavipsychrobacter sp.]
MSRDKKIETLHLFHILDEKLMELLQSLTADEWDMQKVAKRWKVKDVAAHLLDGNLRGLSISRDAYYGEKPENINSYQELVDFLNQLNMSWTNATKRLSPQVLTDLLESTGRAYYEHLKSLSPFDEAVFSVAWAGQETFHNWFHIAREYTEKFLHQQQIRDAVGKPGIMTRELFYPFIDTFMFAFPHTFKEVEAESGTVVSIEVTTGIGGIWSIIKTENDWNLDKSNNLQASAKLLIDPETAWKLFSKSWMPEQVIDKVKMDGDSNLAIQALNLVAVMA